MEKTLSTIQKIAKVGKIFSRIAYVVCIVGGILSLVGFFCFLGGVIAAEKYADISFYEVFSGVVSEGDVYGGTLAAMILCVTEALVAKRAVSFFQHELELGNPFDFPLAEECRKLGIRIIVVPLVGTILAAIVFSVCSALFGGTASFNDAYEVNFSLGIMFFALSYILRYGAYVKEGAETQI